MKKRRIKKKPILILCLLLVIIFLLISPLIFIRISLIGDKSIIVNYGDDYSESGYRLKIFGKDLTKSVKVQDNVKNDIGKYKVIYSYKFLFYKISEIRTVEVKDIKGPKIELNGDDIVDVVINEPYQELGCTAIDNKDGDLTNDVKITGDVNNAILGKYTIIYEVKDKSGNSSTKIRTVNVVRKNPSQMSVSEYSLDGWYDDIKIKETDNMGYEYFNSLIIVGDSNMKNMYEYGRIEKGKSWAKPCLHAESMHYEELNIYGTGTQMTLFSALENYKPEKLIINFGSFSSLWITEDVFRNKASELLEKIKEISPNTEVVLISIYPVTQYGKNNDNFSQNSINKCNFILLELANQYKLKFLDVQTVLKDSTGYGNPSYYISDGFHLTSNGQKIVKEYIQTHAF